MGGGLAYHRTEQVVQPILGFPPAAAFVQPEGELVGVLLGTLFAEVMADTM